MLPMPISRADAEELLAVWQKIRDRQLKAWIDAGYDHTKDDTRQEHIDAFYELLDHGDIIRLTVDEHTALSDAFGGVFHAVIADHYAEVVDKNEELKSAVSKITFAFGRCFGLMNVDMGIEDEHGTN